MKQTTLLAIESSCDETGVSVVRKEGEEVIVLSELIASQVSIHEATGGVVPEVAAREHLTVIGPLIASAMENAGVTKDDLDAIAVTVGPGLMPSLAVGVQAAKTLSFAWEKPIVPVHHIEGHLYSALLTPTPASAGTPPHTKGEITLLTPITYHLEPSPWPTLGLIVSGGHTMLIEMTGHLQYKILGQTRDDAVGEVFDKVARMLQLSYPGGPKVSELAKQGKADAYKFPRPMMQSGDLDFSYSGLKTSVLYKIQELEKAPFDKLRARENVHANIAASFEAAVVDSLAGKLVQALKAKPYACVLLAGGVAANTALQKRISEEAAKEGIALYLAPQALCGDNATMIGQAGLYAYEAGRKKNWREIDAVARVSIEKFSG